MKDNNNILVTGGLGFIGSAFIRYLFRIERFIGRIVNLDLLTYAGNPDNVAGFVDESRYRFIRGDICDQQLVEALCKEYAIDTIVNFAAESHVGRSIEIPGIFLHTNINGVYSLLEVIRARPSIRLHHISTDEVYGSLGETGVFTEKSPYHPNSPYSATKAAADHLIRSYINTFGISATISHCGNNYGPYQFPEKLIPLMITKICNNEMLPIHGSGQYIRDWIYVDDHVGAIWRILQYGVYGNSYNVGGRNEQTNIDIVSKIIELVAEIAGKDRTELERLIRFVEDRPGQDKRYAVDFSKITRELGWVPRHNFETSLRDTVRWYLTNIDWASNMKARR